MNADDPASQGAPGTPMKSRLAGQSLRPVTIKQILEATPSSTTENVILNVHEKEIELGQITLVACVRSLRETGTGADYVLEDGTGSVSGKCWQDKASIPVEFGHWARIFGVVRTMNNARSITILSIRAIADFNEVTLHFLRVMVLNMPKRSTKIAGEEFLDPMQKTILAVYAASQAPQGVHYESVIRALAGKYPASEVRNAISWLTAEGYIFETHDSEHAKLLTSGGL